MPARGHNPFLCSLLVHLGLQINFSKSELHLTPCFFELCWGMVHMCVSLPSGKLDGMWHLAHSLLQGHSVTVCQGMSFLGKADFYANGHSKLCWWWCVIESDMLNVYHSPTYFFSSFHFSGLVTVSVVSKFSPPPIPSF